MKGDYTPLNHLDMSLHEQVSGLFKIIEYEQGLIKNKLGMVAAFDPAVAGRDSFALMEVSYSSVTGVPVATYKYRPPATTIEGKLEFLQELLHFCIDQRCVQESKELDYLFHYVLTFGHPDIPTAVTIDWYKKFISPKNHDRYIKDRLLHGSW